jgi:hypothetical protein
MTGTRNLAGLVGTGATAPPDRTVTAPPPGARRVGNRRRSERRDPPTRRRPSRVPPPVPSGRSSAPGGLASARRRASRVSSRPDGIGAEERPTTVRISVNIPLDAKRWLSAQAREQQRFVSEILMDVVDRHADDVNPSSGRAKRVAVPDGTICSIVLPTEDRARIDEMVARQNTTRSALLTEILRQAVADAP